MDKGLGAHQGRAGSAGSQIKFLHSRCQRQWNNSFKMLRENKCQVRIMYPETPSFKNQDEVNSFTYKQKQGEFYNLTRPRVVENVVGTFGCLSVNEHKLGPYLVRLKICLPIAQQFHSWVNTPRWRSTCVCIHVHTCTCARTHTHAHRGGLHMIVSPETIPTLIIRGLHT